MHWYEPRHMHLATQVENIITILKVPKKWSSQIIFLSENRKKKNNPATINVLLVIQGM